MRKELIGKTVWQLVQQSYTYILDKSKTYLVVAIVEPNHRLPDGRENTDWCEHLILQREDGTLFDIKYYECVVIPDMSLPLAERLAQCLKDNQVYADIWEVNEDKIVLQIDWGDWKHDHGWADTLMGYIGWDCGDVIVTEENGSDCYSATHYYYKRD
jgi:hypothetical protein